MNQQPTWSGGGAPGWAGPQTQSAWTAPPSSGGPQQQVAQKISKVDIHVSCSYVEKLSVNIRFLTIK